MWGVGSGRVALGSSVVAQGVKKARVQRIHFQERGGAQSWGYHQRVWLG